MKNFTEMKGWKYLTGPGWWTGEDAMWVKQAKDGTWFVLRFTDLLDAGGKEFADTPFECSVKQINFAELPEKEIKSALESCGWEEDALGVIFAPYSGDMVAIGDAAVLCKIECCIGYGHGAPLHDETGKRWLHVRAAARRVAEDLMRDAVKLEGALERPVNRIGSTAREYGNGDIDAALYRGPFDVAKDIVRKMHGLPPGDSK